MRYWRSAASAPVSPSPRSTQRWLALILACYLLLALGYGAANPLFEAPDEHRHFFVIQEIVNTNRLPAATDAASSSARQEAAQPPLYYLLSSLLVRPIGVEEIDDYLVPNPFVRLGDAESPTNTNAFVHTPFEAWPWSGPAIAAHLVRAFSAIIGLGTLLCVYGSGRLIWPAAPERALLATALVAFLPQFDFLHGSISNDPLIVFLSAAVLWQLLRLWYDRLSWQRMLMIGGTVGLAILSKTTGLLILLYAAGFVTVLAWRNFQRKEPVILVRSWLGNLALIIFPAALLSAWLLARNWRLYGDITAASQFVQVAGGDRGLSLFEALSESSGLWLSMFAVFGWFNVRAPQWVYLIWSAIVLAAVAGAAFSLLKTMRPRKSNFGQRPAPSSRFSSLLDWSGLPALLLGVWVIMVYAGLLAFMMRTPAAQGRLLFPALLPLALGVAYGLSQYRWTGIFVLAPLLALITSVYCLLFVIPSAYARPPSITESQIPVEAWRLDADLGRGLTLLASQVETPTVLPGEWVWITLYWQAQDVPAETGEERPAVFVLELLGRENALAGKLQSYHGGGLLPASLWSPGEIVVDRLAVKLFEEALAPAKARAMVRLVGEQPVIDIGSTKVVPHQWPDAPGSTLAQIDGLELTGAILGADTARAGETVPIEIQWQVNQVPRRTLTTFIHLGDSSQPPLAQGDSPPLSGHYPTDLWSAGEIINDAYSIEIPSAMAGGRYPLHIGLYDPHNGQRLPLYVSGVRQPNDAFLVGWLTVRP